MIAWASLMLIVNGLFAGGAATFAWSHVPIWRRMPAQEFVGDFEETLRRTDKVRPALLVASGGRRGLRRDPRRVDRSPRAAPAVHRSDAAREGDRGDARPLVSRAPPPLDARGVVVRGDRRGSDLVITR
jgi:hypothetical protein